jgi:hypothetical protein
LISTFGSIKFKLAEQVIRTFTAESATYRVSKDIEDLIEKNKKEGCEKGRATVEGISHYAVEAAILKVYGSEVLNYVIDEAVQIHGGMGYSAEMAVERGYRDSRINRIFEGTNEINRLLVVDTAMKRALKGDFDLFGTAEKSFLNMDMITNGKEDNESYFNEKLRFVKNFKKIILLVIHGAAKHFENKFIQEQEVMNNISDMMIETYVSESTLLRVEKVESLKGAEIASIYKEILDVNIYDASAKIRKSACDAVNSFATGELAVKLLKSIEALTTVSPVNIRNARRKIADKLIVDNAYRF